MLSGPLPASVLRATQFHEFAGQVLARVPGPVALVPRMRTQPVAAREVATALVALARSPAVGRAPELAGPEVHDLVDLARRVARVTGRRRPVVPVRLPGATGRAMAGGALLPTDPGLADARRSRRGWTPLAADLALVQLIPPRGEPAEVPAPTWTHVTSLRAPERPVAGVVPNAASPRTVVPSKLPSTDGT